MTLAKTWPLPASAARKSQENTYLEMRDTEVGGNGAKHSSDGGAKCEKAAKLKVVYA